MKASAQTIVAVTNDRRVIYLAAMVRFYGEALAHSTVGDRFSVRRLHAMGLAVVSQYVKHLPKKVVSTMDRVIGRVDGPDTDLTADTVLRCDFDHVTTAKVGILVAVSNVHYLIQRHVDEADADEREAVTQSAVCVGLLTAKAAVEKELQAAASAAAGALDASYKGRYVSVAGNELSAPLLIIEDQAPTSLVSSAALEAADSMISQSLEHSSVSDSADEALEEILAEQAALHGTAPA